MHQRLKVKSMTIPSYPGNTELLEPSPIAGGDTTITFKNSWAVSYKVKHTLTIRSSNPIPMFLLKKKWKHMSIYMNCRKAKITVTKSRLVIAWSLRHEGRELTAKEEKGPFREERTILYLNYGCRHMTINICQNSSHFVLKTHEVH